MSFTDEDFKFDAPASSPRPNFTIPPARNFHREQSRVADQSPDWRDDLSKWWDELPAGERETMIDLFKTTREYERTKGLCDRAICKGYIPIILKQWAREQASKVGAR
jgi:hypothetical protein